MYPNTTYSFKLIQKLSTDFMPLRVSYLLSMDVCLLRGFRDKESYKNIISGFLCSNIDDNFAQNPPLKQHSRKADRSVTSSVWCVDKAWATLSLGWQTPQVQTVFFFSKAHFGTNRQGHFQRLGTPCKKTHTVLEALVLFTLTAEKLCRFHSPSGRP